MGMLQIKQPAEKEVLFGFVLQCVMLHIKELKSCAQNLIK